MGPEVAPGTPAVLPLLQVGVKAARLDLARWLVARENPLTARVAVNRMWQEFFGRGLVRTSEDFGTQGEKPSHPELLDWLAGGVVGPGWGIEQMAKTIVSAAPNRRPLKIWRGRGKAVPGKRRGGGWGGGGGGGGGGGLRPRRASGARAAARIATAAACTFTTSAPRPIRSLRISTSRIRTWRARGGAAPILRCRH